MKHIWGNSDFGCACFRCGYFSHTDEAVRPCSGRYDEKLKADLEKQCEQIELKLKLLADAKKEPTP